LLSQPSERNKQRDGECAVVHRVCPITMLTTDGEGRSFILLFVHHLSRMPEFVLLLVVVKLQPEVALLAIVEMGTPLIPPF